MLEKPRLSPPRFTWISTFSPVTPAHRTSASTTLEVGFPGRIDRVRSLPENHPQYFPIIRPHHNNPGINGHAPPHQQEGREDTGKMNIGEGSTGYHNRSPVIFGKTVHHGPVHQEATIQTKLLNRRGCVSTVGHSGSEASHLETKRSVRKV